MLDPGIEDEEQPTEMRADALHLDRQIDSIVSETELVSAAVAFCDHQSNTMWNYNGNTFFHAASTIKVAILLGVFALVDDGVVELDSKVHVRNRFFSVVDDKLYRMQSSRDACSSLYASLGKTMSVSELAYHMIVTSSNLATNLLIDVVGVGALQEKLHQMGVEGIELRRGVEDELAFDTGIINRVTANGLVDLFANLYRGIDVHPDLAERILQILFAQKFNQGLPLGVPAELRSQSRFAHKTGEISTVAHDAGMVFLPDRKPYSLSILTERLPGKSNSRKAIQKISRLIYRAFIDAEEQGTTKRAS